MRRRLELIDTSVLLELLQIPGWHSHAAELQKTFASKQDRGVTFQLPAATMLESGAHISRIPDGEVRRQHAAKFEELLRLTVAGETPWTFTALAWDRDFVIGLLDPPDDYLRIQEAFAARSLEMGDLLILAELRAVRAGVDSSYLDVGIWTLDEQLQAAADYWPR